MAMDPETWGTSKVARHGSIAITLFLVLVETFFLAVMAANLPDLGAIVGLGVVAALATLTIVAAWAFAFRPRIEVAGERLLIANPIRSYVVRLADIQSVRPTYSGIQIVTTDNDSVSSFTAWAVQKSNWSQARGANSTRADKVATAIRRAAEQGRHASESRGDNL